MSPNPIAGKRPASVSWLGYGGLLPFLALTLGSVLDVHHRLIWADALVGYGAVILSFVGALHWGLAMALPDLSDTARRGRYVWSVVPALLAWPATLLSADYAALLLIIGFVAHYLQDRSLAGRASLPGWYLPLRLQLTAVACLCLATAGTLEAAHQGFGELWPHWHGPMMPGPAQNTAL